MNESVHAKSEKNINCSNCHGSHYIQPVSDELSIEGVTEQISMCGKCHYERIMTASGYRLRAVIHLYNKSAHLKALQDGKEASSCTACHNSHNIKPRSEVGSPISAYNTVQKCKTCHEQIYNEYAESVHGQAFLHGVREVVPDCIYCHGAHHVRSKSDPDSPTAPENAGYQLCGPCHSRKAMHDRFDLDLEKAETYENSFHGLVKQYDPKAKTANCGDCHGIHKILHEKNPDSTIHASNLRKTCGVCHEEITDKFVAGKIHRTVEKTGTPAAEIIKIIYLALIFFVIGGMFLHNVFDYARKIQLRLKNMKAEKYVIRFKPQETVQHWILLITFFFLALTGFMLKFPNAFWVQPLKWIGINAAMRGIIHRVAAVLFVMLSVYHTYYIALTRRGRDQIKAMMPQMKDFKDFFHMALFFLGIKKDIAKFERFNYAEKAEYLALLWGSVLMIITGVVLWFKDLATQIIPKWGYDIAEVAHYYEAWLATLAIIVWHLYHVLLNPSARPINLSVFHGRMSMHEMENEHPLELQRLKKEKIKDTPKPKKRKKKA